ASTLSFMKEEGWIHAIADEPQAGDGSIPIVPKATNPDMTLIRMHGRNIHGWNKPRDADTNWREVRYLYKYNLEELLKWKNRIEELKKNQKNIIIHLKNEWGGKAGGNVKVLQKSFGTENKGLSPRQLIFFWGGTVPPFSRC